MMPTLSEESFVGLVSPYWVILSDLSMLTDSHIAELGWITVVLRKSTLHDELDFSLLIQDVTLLKLVVICPSL
jgi:hypothetical protein